MREENPTLTQEVTNETNCLALTIRKDYSLSIAKNILHKTGRMSWKIALNLFLLNIMAILF